MVAKLFFSYSHKDEDLRDELETHLAMLKRQGLVDAVHDRRITAGADLDAAIDGYLEEADVILCLVSPDFLASDYCYSREMGRALERHRAGDARVIPVILRHCDWRSTPLSGLRGTPRDNRPVKAWPDRDEAWLDVTRDIRQALAESAGDSPPNAAAPRSATPGPAAPTPPTALRPRSSNLAVTREFTDLDRDEYLRQSCDFLAEFFPNSLDEVRARADGVEGAVRHLDANRFTASAYRHGRKLAAITVFVGGGMSRSGRTISFHLSDDGATNTSNGSFHVAESERELGFKGLFDPYGGSRDTLSGREHVAERIWGAFIEPLQQRQR